MLKNQVKFGLLTMTKFSISLRSGSKLSFIYLILAIFGLSSLLTLPFVPPHLTLQSVYSQSPSDIGNSTSDNNLNNTIPSATNDVGGGGDLNVTNSNVSMPEIPQRGEEENNVTSVSSADFNTLREQYLQSWDGLGFNSSYDTFLKGYPFIQTYGGYDARVSNVFAPGESIWLYVEPVGFAHKEYIDSEGNPIYSVNITSNISVSDSQGSSVGTTSIPFEFQNSYRKVTELYLLLEVRQEPPFPEGEYTATYQFTDGTTGETFELVKEFRIAETVDVG